jgi:septal ring factor EnvC (AmiA/AmiB activator)
MLFRKLTGVVLVLTLSAVHPLVMAADPAAEKAALEEKLKAAIAALEADKANYAETSEKLQAIEAKLAERKKREEQIKAEMMQLCEEQEKLNPGAKAECVEKLNN